MLLANCPASLSDAQSSFSSVFTPVLPSQVSTQKRVLSPPNTCFLCPSLPCPLWPPLNLLPATHHPCLGSRVSHRCPFCAGFSTSFLPLPAMCPNSLVCWHCLGIPGESQGHCPGIEGPFCVTALSVYLTFPSCLPDMVPCFKSCRLLAAPQLYSLLSCPVGQDYYAWSCSFQMLQARLGPQAWPLSGKACSSHWTSRETVLPSRASLPFHFLGLS